MQFESAPILLRHFSLAQAIEGGALIEEWYATFPGDKKDVQARILSAKEANAVSAITEIYLHHCWRRSGLNVQVHPEMPNSSRRPDFLVKGIYVEVVALLNDKHVDIRFGEATCIEPHLSVEKRLKGKRPAEYNIQDERYVVILASTSPVVRYEELIRAAVGGRVFDSDTNALVPGYRKDGLFQLRKGEPQNTRFSAAGMVQFPFNGFPFRESPLALVLNPYAKTKIAGDELGAEYVLDWVDEPEALTARWRPQPPPGLLAGA